MQSYPFVPLAWAQFVGSAKYFMFPFHIDERHNNSPDLSRYLSTLYVTLSRFHHESCQLIALF